MNASPETAPPAAPFVHRRRVVWSDSDPAGIAYTGRFADFALEAIEAWSEARLGLSWYVRRHDGPSVPFVHIEMDFRSPLRAGDWLLSEVRLEKVGRTSITTAVAGRREDGTLSFQGRFTQVCVSPDLQPMPIPDTLRPAIERELALEVAG